MSKRNGSLLVTGAAGQLGRQVVELLLAAGEASIVAATRDPSKLADLAERGVDVRRVDFDDAASLGTAFAGAERALLISTDAVDRPGRRLEQHVKAVDALARAQVKHVLYTSIVNPVEGAASFVADDHRKTEAAVARSGLGYTALRNNLYIDLSLPVFTGAIAQGKLFAARGTGKASFVTRSDCARAAAAALASSFDGKRTLDITGPDALGGDDLAAILTEISGKPVAYVPITPDAAVAGMVAHGFPEPIARAYVTFDVGIERGELAVVSSAVEQLTGKKPERIRDFLAERRSALGL